MAQAYSAQELKIAAYAMCHQLFLQKLAYIIYFFNLIFQCLVYFPRHTD